MAPTPPLREPGTKHRRTRQHLPAGRVYSRPGESGTNGAIGVNRNLSVQTGLDGTVLDGQILVGCVLHPWRKSSGGRSAEQPELPEPVRSRRRGPDAKRNDRVLRGDPGSNRCTICQLRSHQSIWTNRDHPGRFQLYQAAHIFPPDQYSERHQEPASRARCSTIGRDRSRPLCRPKAASTIMP